MKRFAAIDSDGTVLGVESDVESAIERAQNSGVVGAPITVEVWNESPTKNPADPPATELVATRQTGLPYIDIDEVHALSLAEAHKRLAPLFEGLKQFKAIKGAPKAWLPVKGYKTPSDMAKKLLGLNYKLAKQKAGAPPSTVHGLMLMPAHFVHQPKLPHGDEANPATVAKLSARFGLGVIPKLPGTTLCAGSNDACRSSCLVFSGQNAADDYNMVIKTARTLALYKDPVAFGRLLIHSVAFWEEHFAKKRITYATRLNTLSDIPWEEIFPGIFEEFPRSQFYDYTKVGDRVTPHNYDITYSFSGTNKKQALRELSRGRRVAAVFLLPGGYVARKTAPMPKTFWDYPVVDGDNYDMRYLDPGEAVIGLRWKTPRKVELDPRDPRFRKFVTEIFEEDGALIAPVTFRHEPGVDSDFEDDEAEMDA